MKAMGKMPEDEAKSDTRQRLIYKNFGLKKEAEEASKINNTKVYFEY
jgi:hypothetical protein